LTTLHFAKKQKNDQSFKVIKQITLDYKYSFSMDSLSSCRLHGAGKILRWVILGHFLHTNGKSILIGWKAKKLPINRTFKFN